MFLTRNSGICAACGKSLACTYAKNQPVISCEEFDGYTMTIPARGISPLAHSWVCLEEEIAPGGSGLCGTCRKQCECGGTDKSDCKDYR